MLYDRNIIRENKKYILQKISSEKYFHQYSQVFNYFEEDNSCTEDFDCIAAVDMSKNDFSFGKAKEN